LVNSNFRIAPKDFFREGASNKNRLMEIEHFFTCPYCWQEVSMILDPSVEEQSYIEDCEVCCRPIQIFYTAADFELTDFQADSIEQ
jgi:transcription elongation factor Elf1